MKKSIDQAFLQVLHGLKLGECIKLSIFDPRQVPILPKGYFLIRAKLTKELYVAHGTKSVSPYFTKIRRKAKV